MGQKIIIDVGVHKGEDSDFYLQRGYKVIGVEASEKLCEFITEKFKDHPYKENFTLLNYAITEKDNELIPFYENTVAAWSTISEEWNTRNKKLGSGSEIKMVKTIRLDTLINGHIAADKEIEYIKIDIEGADQLALQSLKNATKKAKFISIESEKHSWDKLLEEFEIFKNLGYTKFKVIDQSKMNEQSFSYNMENGEQKTFHFDWDCSGPFGDDLPGEWIAADEAIKIYKKVFRRYKYWGESSQLKKFILKHRYLNSLRFALKIRFPHTGWHDTHATF